MPDCGTGVADGEALLVHRTGDGFDVTQLLQPGQEHRQSGAVGQFHACVALCQSAADKETLMPGKAQVDLSAGSPGVLVNLQSGFRRGGSVSLFSLALDFVF
jgi:hypothetical protein